MPPKRKDKDAETTKNPRMDHIQADHELFLQAFESRFFKNFLTHFVYNNLL